MGVRFGRYELLRRLGKGGMAEVFLARSVGPGGFEKRLVIKRVLPALGGDRRFLKLFFEEARTHVSLSHGNLVPVFDFGRVGNAHFIAMEHVPGCDLATLIAAGHARGETLPPLLVAHIGIELCHGLGYVHRRGFVHRDVSPRNVLVSRDGEIKLSDFGVALAAATEAAPGLRGTLAYMAPEQARGERVDGRADLFALGVVLAEALQGRRMRKHADDAAALAAARAGAPIVVDGPLGAIVARATATAPADRYADADAMLVALEEAAAALGRVGATAARQLAERVAAWVPERDDDDAAPADAGLAETKATVGEETYFRDRESASFVDDVFAEPRATTAARRRRRAWWTAAAVVVAGVSIVVTGRAVQLRHRAAPPIATTSPPTSAPAQPSPSPAPSAPPPVATPAPAPPASATVHRTTPHHAPAASGTVLVQCTPWCIPFVDGERRGDDGRNHRLLLPPGAHRVGARRLDDRLERAVDVRGGQSQTVTFTFE